MRRMKRIMIGWLALVLSFGILATAIGETLPAVPEGAAAAATDTSRFTVTPSPAAGPDIIINENSFLYQTGRMNENPDEYIGETVQIEGMFGSFHYGDEDNLQTYYMVYRYFEGNNCCAADVTGLEVYWPEEHAVYPEENTWVRAEGVLETYELDGIIYLQARLTSMEPLDEPGEALVTESNPEPTQ